MHYYISSRTGGDKADPVLWVAGLLLSNYILTKEYSDYKVEFLGINYFLFTAVSYIHLLSLSNSIDI